MNKQQLKLGMILGLTLSALSAHAFDNATYADSTAFMIRHGVIDKDSAKVNVNHYLRITQDMIDKYEQEKVTTTIHNTPVRASVPYALNYNYNQTDALSVRKPYIADNVKVTRFNNTDAMKGQLLGLVQEAKAMFQNQVKTLPTDKAYSSALMRTAKYFGSDLDQLQTYVETGRHVQALKLLKEKRELFQVIDNRI